MAQLALVIGSQTGGLNGVHGDVEVMEDALGGLGFTVRRAIEKDATNDAIVAAYHELIEDVRDGDAVVVYYSGHGNRQGNALHTRQPDAPRWLQYLVPTDADDRSGGRFRGLLAQELSLLQRQLTDKTPNVTTILDCCHSARMSRDSRLFPKASTTLPPFPWADLEARWRAVVAEAGDASTGDDNPHAVRLVACSPEQSAYELAETALGGAHGALTSQLVPVLKSPGASRLSWREVLDIVRPAVMDVVSQQRPEIEGRHLGRLLFSLDEKDTTGVLAITVDGDQAFVEHAALFGVAEGDTYAIVGPGGDATTPLATAIVDRVARGRARLFLQGLTVGALPAGAAAVPVVTAVGARPIAVIGVEPTRTEVADRLRKSASLRVVDQTTDVLATVEAGDTGLQLLDAAGEPVLAAPRPLSDGSITLLVRDLERLARATHLRELESGRGDSALVDEVSMTFSLLQAEGEVVLPPSGAHLHDGDRLVVRFENNATEARYVSVLDIGLTGSVSLLSTSEPDGVTLAPRERYELGRDNVGALVGLELFWPDGLPPVPRSETFVILVSDSKVSGLARLTQEGVSTRRGGADATRSALERLIDDVTTGRRDAATTETEERRVRHLVKRLDFVLHPDTGAAGPAEPTFEIEDRPDNSFRMVAPTPRATVPKHVVVRLVDLGVNTADPRLSAGGRLDAVVVTAPEAAAPPGAPYRTTTVRLPTAGPVIIHDGPVSQFVDIALWLSPPHEEVPPLADLLASDSGRTDIERAAADLFELGSTAPPDGAVPRSIAAVATIVDRIGAVLEGSLPSCGPLYRTTLLPHESFGVRADGSGSGRRPTAGLIQARGLSFALEVADRPHTPIDTHEG